LATAGEPAGQAEPGPAEKRASIADDPHNRQIVLQTALSALRQGQAAKAIAILAGHRDDLADSAPWFRTLGAAYYQEGDYRSAHSALERALSLDDTSAAAHFLLGCTLSKLGQPEPAERHYEQARTLDPKYARAAPPARR
jgi:Tfp pilus assembly protein PilF